MGHRGRFPLFQSWQRGGLLHHETAQLVRGFLLSVTERGSESAVSRPLGVPECLRLEFR